MFVWMQHSSHTLTTIFRPSLVMMDTVSADSKYSNKKCVRGRVFFFCSATNFADEKTLAHIYCDEIKKKTLIEL